MLNEKRVKHMVRLAFYESKGGSEEIRINSFRRKLYVNFQTLWSIMWMTVAYALFVLMVGMATTHGLIFNFTTKERLIIILLVGGCYLGLLVLYFVKTRKFYKKKHARAHHRVAKFKEGLSELERMYEKEDNDGENI